ncbi:hypothetical protein BSKO_08427 [Bryopsis sp. KO-2023]|nr:hypothetical protein BSKO_08427 [Bryopsis sp. KO-2023]
MPSHGTQPDPSQASFFAWMRESKIRCPKCGIKIFEETGRGVVALEPIREGEIVVEVPDDFVLWEETSMISSYLREKGLVREEGRLPEFLGLVVAVMHEKYLGDQSRWGPYMDFLPDSVDDLPFAWSERELESLVGTSVLDKMDPPWERCDLEPPCQVDFWYDEIVKPFARRERNIGFPRGARRKKLYLWATGVVSSYAFTLGDEKLLGIVPMWDMLNHVSGKCNVRLNHCEERGVLQMIASQNIAEGSEVINSFGALSNSELLRFYGFVEPHVNPPIDCVELCIWEVIEKLVQTKEEVIKTPTDRLEFLHVHGLMPNNGWFKIIPGKGPPIELTECLRVVTLPQTKFEELKEKVENWRFPKVRPMNRVTEHDFGIDVSKFLLGIVKFKVKAIRRSLSEGQLEGNQRVGMAMVVCQSEQNAWKSLKKWLVAGESQAELWQHPRRAWSQIRDR